MALTQPLAVEPCGWGLRGVAAQCFVVNSIFKYLLLIELKTNVHHFRAFAPQLTTRFNIEQR
jgi:hypothetical protein